MQATSLLPLILASGLLACSGPPPATGSHLPDGYVPEDPARTIFLGGAVTDGRGASDDDLAYPALLRRNDAAVWPDAVGVDLRTLFPDLAEVHNVADGNPTVPTILEEQLPALAAALGDSVEGQTLVVLTVGGKDLAAQEGTVGQLIDGIDELIEFFQDPERFPDGVFIYLPTLYNPADGLVRAEPDCLDVVEAGAVRAMIPNLNRRLFDLAVEREIALVDTYDHFAGHGYFFDDEDAPAYDAEDPTGWLADCRAPNDRGHHELRRLFYAAMVGAPLESE